MLGRIARSLMVMTALLSAEAGRAAAAPKCTAKLKDFVMRVQGITNNSADMKKACIELRNNAESSKPLASRSEDEKKDKAFGSFAACSGDAAFKDAWDKFLALCEPAVKGDWEGKRKFSTDRPDADVIDDAANACPIPPEFDDELMRAIIANDICKIKKLVAKINETRKPPIKYIIHNSRGGSGGGNDKDKGRIQFIFPGGDGNVYLQMGFNTDFAGHQNVSVICDKKDGARFRDTTIEEVNGVYVVTQPKTPTVAGTNDCTNCHTKGRPLGVHGEIIPGGNVDPETVNGLEFVRKYEKETRKPDETFPGGRTPVVPETLAWGLTNQSDTDLLECADTKLVTESGTSMYDCSGCHAENLLDTSSNAEASVREGWMPPNSKLTPAQRTVLADLLAVDRKRKICKALGIAKENCPDSSLPAGCMANPFAK